MGNNDKIADLQEQITTLKQENQKYKSIIEHSMDGIVLIDEQGKVIEWNKAMEKITGKQRNQLVGKDATKLRFNVFPSKEQSDEAYQRRTNLLKERLQGTRQVNSKIYEVEIQNLNGEKKIIQDLPFNIKTDKGHMVCSIIRDITEKRLNQQILNESQKSELKKYQYEMARLDRLSVVGQMAAGVSHEVRNPMTTVRGLLQLLSDKEDCEKYYKYYHLMIEELDRANSIIKEFLSMVRNKEYTLNKVNLNQLLDNMYPLINADASNSGLSIKLHTEDIPILELNEKEIRQLILNLVRNSIEAMKPGGVITISTYIEKNEIILAISDQGAGIPDEILGKLGTPFLTTKEHGTGLGLAICYSIAAKNNAHIDVDTTSTGTTFYIRFKKT